jgi:putative transposase
MQKIEHNFPLSHDVSKVDGRPITIGIIFVIQDGLRWRDAPRE